jgi:hypothetical protein
MLPSVKDKEISIAPLPPVLIFFNDQNLLYTLLQF